jgi:hypothetical protein
MQYSANEKILLGRFCGQTLCPAEGNGLMEPESKHSVRCGRIWETSNLNSA